VLRGALQVDRVQLELLGVPARVGVADDQELHAPVLRSGLEAGFGPAPEHLDLPGRPGAVAGHGAVIEALEDPGGVGLDIVAGPQRARC
jgi:hypothetical protein